MPAAVASSRRSRRALMPVSISAMNGMYDIIEEADKVITF